LQQSNIPKELGWQRLREEGIDRLEQMLESGFDMNATAPSKYAETMVSAARARARARGCDDLAARAQT